MDINWIRDKIYNNEYDFSEHAHRERQEEQITVLEIEKTLLEGGIIEQYPLDPRGKSCLVAGKITSQPLHIVCGIRSDRLLIVTVYRPKEPAWKDYKSRAEELKSRV